MDSKAIKEVFEELFTHLERLETQSAAILQFLKEKKRVTDKQLAPYLEQAGNAANVKWRAARVRIERLLSDEDEEDKKIEKKPEIAQAERTQNEKKQTNGESKDQAAKEHVVSPELEAAVQRNAGPGKPKEEPEQKKKADEKDLSPDRQPVTASDKREESADKQRPEGDQPVQATSKPQETQHEEPGRLAENHPTQMTQDTVQRDSGKPADEMKPGEKGKNDQEAA